VNSITAGFGGRQASADVDSAQKSSWGKISYWISALSKLGDMPEFDVRFSADGRQHEIRCLGFWLANGRYVGGGFPVAPTARIDDGLLDLVVMPSLPALDLIAAGVDFTVSGPEQAEQILTLRATRIELTTEPVAPLSIDGDPSDAGRLECNVLPGALRIVAGTLDPALDST
jgi:diacylglycerol kinase family enzyme